MFNHYVAVDWAMSNMAIARITEKSNKITTIDVPSDIKELRIYLQNLKGKICLTIEETTTSQWLYTELKDCVDKIVICDPYRNKLLSEGAKTDKIDAEKLVKLLKGDLLKEVFHSGDKFIELRKIVSAYEDTIKAGVRFKNQRSALFRAYNKNHKEEVELAGYVDTFVLKGLDLQITNYENERKRYQDEFNRLRRAHPVIFPQKSGHEIYDAKAMFSYSTGVIYSSAEWRRWRLYQVSIQSKMAFLASSRVINILL
jgi:hypothetical protein